MLVGLMGLAVLAGPKDNNRQAGLHEHGGIGEEVYALARQLATGGLVQIIHDVMLIGAGHGGEHLAHIGICGREIGIILGSDGQGALDMSLDILPALAGNGAKVQLHLRMVGHHIGGGAGGAAIDADGGHAQGWIGLGSKGQLAQRFHEARHLQ